MTEPVEARCGAGAGEQQEGVSISKLPDELLTHVFSFCDQRTLGQCAQVCRKWNTVSSDDQVWREQSITIGRRVTNIAVPRHGAKDFHRAEDAKVIRSIEELLAKITGFANGLRPQDLPALFVGRFFPPRPNHPLLAIRVREQSGIPRGGMSSLFMSAENVKSFCEWYLVFEGRSEGGDSIDVTFLGCIESVVIIPRFYTDEEQNHNLESRVRDSIYRILSGPRFKPSTSGSRFCTIS